jgi:hypothetical protein
MRQQAQGEESRPHRQRAGRRCRGKLAPEEKSNEITAVPELLERLEVAGDTITIDARRGVSGRQRRRSGRKVRITC